MGSLLKGVWPLSKTPCYTSCGVHKFFAGFTGLHGFVRVRRITSEHREETPKWFDTPWYFKFHQCDICYIFARISSTDIYVNEIENIKVYLHYIHGAITHTAVFSDIFIDQPYAVISCKEFSGYRWIVFKQESIAVGCLPPACQSYMSQPPDISTSGGCVLKWTSLNRSPGMVVRCQ